MKKILLTLLFVQTLFALDFSFIKKESTPKDDTLLIIGGIQGDEPGGFNAASLIATRYTILKGNVWIVPNLNFLSIIKRSRGVHGDMNRKFSALAKDDPEFPLVNKIKKIITDKQVDLVLNLHDGSGFFRKEYVDKWKNPNRWGQSCIIDQEKISAPKYSNLGEIGEYVVAHVNRNLLDTEHRFSLKNTRTSDGDKEMEKSLTFFAISNNKPAFGVEGSKQFGTQYRAYYHLLAVEAYMNYMGIEFERDFELTPLAVKNAIYNNYKITLFDKIALPTKNIRPVISYLPTDKEQITYSSDNPLVCVVKQGNGYKVHYGNNRVTTLRPEYFKYDHSIETVPMLIDGIHRDIKIGEMVYVKNRFKIDNKDGYRVNVIGYKNKYKRNESGINIKKGEIAKRFSIDKSGTIYRIEIYKKKKFSGMVLVKFVQNQLDSNSEHVVTEGTQAPIGG